eukprot:TRINITY_DN30050_c0_g1_i1.p1 TRINITY_DN30050_c0_g1~~TRINITY_DN30050_c0_g1_i1.p1  ORF type:complete len:555 (-),score=148.97 TRINITY_DN30050_c0_g1_i1:111-1775(-)
MRLQLLTICTWFSLAVLAVRVGAIRLGEDDEDFATDDELLNSSAIVERTNFAIPLGIVAAAKAISFISSMHSSAGTAIEAMTLLRHKVMLESDLQEVTRAMAQQRIDIINEVDGLAADEAGEMRTVKLLSEDSMEALQNAVTITGRISEMCAEQRKKKNGQQAGEASEELARAVEVLEQEAAHQQQIYERLKVSTCEHLTTRSKKEVDDMVVLAAQYQQQAGAKGLKDGIFYNYVRAQNKFYEPITDQYDGGYVEEGHMSEMQLEAMCTAKDFTDLSCPGWEGVGASSLAQEAQALNHTQSATTPEQLMQAFDQAATRLIRMLKALQQLHCQQPFTPCQNQLMICVPGARDLYGTMEELWNPDKVDVVKDFKERAGSMLSSVWGGMKGIAKKVGLANLLNKILPKLWKYRSLIWAVLTRPFSHAVTFKDKIKSHAIGQMLKLAKKMAKVTGWGKGPVAEKVRSKALGAAGKKMFDPGLLSKFFKLFSWLGLKAVDAIPIESHCIHAAAVLSGDEHGEHETAAERVVNEIIQSYDEEVSESGQTDEVAAYSEAGE